MKLTIQTGGVPPGVYRCRYDGGEEMETKFGLAYKLKFTVIGGEFDGKETSRLVNPGSTSPKSNISIYFAALAGVAPEDGVNIDDALFIGCEYQIVVEKHGDEGFTKVGSILRRLQDGDQTSDEEAEALF